ncbi:dUTP diphosphatase [Bacillus toyonensis]|uniref:dUTP diphosphatase n=1 Tax=Bacillus toyonensis TaxID=155322 RepID=UPI003D22712D
MDLIKLFKLQKTEDNYITKESDVELKQILTEKTLALLGTISELVNETCCEKYRIEWSTCKVESILTKYVKGLQLILSMGIILGIDKNLSFYNCKLTNDKLTENFVRIYENTIYFNKEPIIINYMELITSYIYLRQVFELGQEETEKAYIDNYLKNNRIKQIY